MKRSVWKSFVCGLLIVVMLASSAPAFASSVARIMKVTGDYVRLRTSSSQGSSVVTRLRKGDKVLYWGQKDGSMYKVLTTSGKTGYVYRSYLTTYGAMQLNKVYVTTASTKMYNANKRGIGTLSKGKYVMVYKTQGNWAYVKTMSGKGAFVNRSTLKRAF